MMPERFWRLVLFALATVMLASVTLSLCGWAGFGWAVRLQLVPAVLSLNVAALAALAVMTAYYGRFFCRAMCPLGILQTVVNRLFHLRRPVRRICTRLPVTRGQCAVRCVTAGLFVIAGAFGFGVVLGALDPYSIYARLVAFACACWSGWPDEGVVMAFWSVGVFALVMVLAAVGHGRVWCNWICPVGTVFAFLSHFSRRRDVVGPGCGRCRKCTGKTCASKGTA